MDRYNPDYYCQEHKRDFKPDECISCEISKDLIDKDDEIKRLREALEDIKKHQEIASGTLSSLSATYLIASKALEVKS